MRPDPGLDAIMSERRQLINLAYRLLGSLADAEDVVQETYARWYAMSPPQQEAIESPGAWLTTVASRICLDLLGSARVRRERYVGEWIPEPLPDARSGDGGTAARRRPGRPGHPRRVGQHGLPRRARVDDPGRARRVHPARRLPLLVRRRWPRSSAARRRPAASWPPRPAAASAPRDSAPRATRRADVVRDFKQAWEAKDIDALIGLLDPDATAIADGGGLASAVPAPDRGQRADRALLRRARRRWRPDLRFLERTVNGQPGLVAQQDGVTVTVLAFDVAGDGCAHLGGAQPGEAAAVVVIVSG